jgi:hypothetical protein
VAHNVWGSDGPTTSVCSPASAAKEREPHHRAPLDEALLERGQDASQALAAGEGRRGPGLRRRIHR